MVPEGYVPTDHALIAAWLIDLRPGIRHCELGSGDGRVVRFALDRGCYSVGFELNEELVRKSRAVAPTIVLMDYMAPDWSLFDAITAFVDASNEAEVIAKFQRECALGARLYLYGGRVIEHA